MFRWSFKRWADLEVQEVVCACAMCSFRPHSGWLTNEPIDLDTPLSPSTVHAVRLPLCVVRATGGVQEQQLGMCIDTSPLVACGKQSMHHSDALRSSVQQHDLGSFGAPCQLRAHWLPKFMANACAAKCLLHPCRCTLQTTLFFPSSQAS